MSNLNGRKTKSLNDIPEVFKWRGHDEWKILLKVPLEDVASERSKVLNEERKDVFIVPVRKLEDVEQSNSEDEANEEEERLKKAEVEKISRIFKPEETEKNPLGDGQFSLARRNHTDDHQFLERNLDLHGHSRRHDGRSRHFDVSDDFGDLPISSKCHSNSVGDLYRYTHVRLLVSNKIQATYRKDLAIFNECKENKEILIDEDPYKKIKLHFLRSS
ncbi:hypothetical protein K0M31_012289 [Melipona bicolor]|uniref:Uncharacterized protein n=1 Tax=Melipona bicolor TaxID=60889 RepID=A0AA40KHQ4_9HYME|nr:hypothetical protein K0M31_012289 [Melipona bicolor]